MSRAVLRTLILVIAALSVSGCALMPRGAGLQSEVLAQPESEDGQPADFTVEPITRAFLTTYDRWPDVGQRHYSWISAKAQPANRIIAPGDQLDIVIWDSSDNGLLTNPGQRTVSLPKLKVSSSGRVHLPYIGSIKLSGMSPDHARQRVENAYAAVTTSPQVQLSMSEGRQNMVSLVTGVSKPGAYPLADSAMTIAEAIALGGGVHSSLVNANPQLRLQRGSRTYGTSLNQLLKDPSRDTTLRGGDKIFINKDERNFLSLGAAGLERVHAFPKDEISALDAMAIVGGLRDDRANARGILILREYPTSAIRNDRSGPSTERVVFTVDLTKADGLFSAGQFEIQPGDLVYVTESNLTATRTVIALMSSVFGLRNTINK